MPAIKQAIKPLFERLIDEDTEIPFEKEPQRFLSLSELQESIIKALSDLFNTRASPIKSSAVDDSTVIPFLYGINIHESICSENPDDMKELEGRMEDAARRFEPRLASTKINFIGVGNDPSTLFINVDAVVTAGNMMVPLSFPITVTC